MLQAQFACRRMVWLPHLISDVPHHNRPAWQPLDYAWLWLPSPDPTLTRGLISVLDLRLSSSMKTCLAIWTLAVVPGVPCLPHSGVVAGPQLSWWLCYCSWLLATRPLGSSCLHRALTVSVAPQSKSWTGIYFILLGFGKADSLF